MTATLGLRSAGTPERLGYYSVVLAAIVAFELVMGLLHHATEPDPGEPIWAHLLIASVPLAVIGWYYSGAYAQRWIRTLLYGALYWVLAGTVALVWMNGFAADYAVGLLFVVAAAGVMVGVESDRKDVFLGFAGYCLLLTGIAALSARTAAVSPLALLGCMAGMLLVIQVATRIRLRWQAALVESEHRFQVLSEATSEAIFLLKDGRILDVNEQARRLLRCDDLTALMGLRFSEAAAPACRAAFEAVEAGRSRGQAVEGELLRRDGTSCPVVVQSRAIRYRGAPVRVVVVRDETERRRIEADRMIAQRHAEEAQRLKATLFANLSHELRTPLALILGYAELMLPDVDEEAQEGLHVILDSGRRLNDVVTRVLELLQLDEERVALRDAAVDLAQVASEVVALRRAEADARGLALELVVPKEPVPARLDRSRLLRIVDCLAGNALKFTEAGSIRVEVDHDGQWGRVCVRDTGVGIDAAFLPRLFTPFAQEAPGLSHPGVGIGLAVTRHLVEQMGGRIEVESVKGEGSTFTVRFPLAAVPARAA